MINNSPLHMFTKFLGKRNLKIVISKPLGRYIKTTSQNVNLYASIGHKHNQHYYHPRFFFFEHVNLISHLYVCVIINWCLFACVSARTQRRGWCNAGAADPRVIISCSYFKFTSFFAWGGKAETVIISFKYFT